MVWGRTRMRHGRICTHESVFAEVHLRAAIVPFHFPSHYDRDPKRVRGRRMK